MTALFDHTLETVFYGFLRRDPDLLAAIDAFHGALDLRDNALEFTLPALHEFVCCSYKLISGHKISGDRESYLRFRKALYGNPTNSLLMAQGGRVELAVPNRNHDLVVYRLVGRTDQV